MKSLDCGDGCHSLENTVKAIWFFFGLGMAIACDPTPEDSASTTVESCVQDYDGHDACKSENGFLFFCGPDGDCIEASGCLAESCCVPGEQGDASCQATFGDCSECVAGYDGECDPQECEE